ncbi:MAG: hypothetical protein Q4F11_04200, partial [Eubacteriales bacterium]|nr:hypothetical protein [Eubacteriales bacterium]
RREKLEMHKAQRPWLIILREIDVHQVLKERREKTVQQVEKIHREKEKQQAEKIRRKKEVRQTEKMRQVQIHSSQRHSRG